MFKFTSLGAREIKKYSFVLIIVVLILGLCGHFFSTFFFYLLIIPVWGWAGLFYFFRDPERKIPENSNALLSPADGVITHIEKIGGSEITCEQALRISIFLSVFDVHLNRAPFRGKVEKIIYKKGEFFDARDNNSLAQNESNTIIFGTDHKILPVFAIRQIAGFIARRIVCIVKSNDTVCAGSRIGMMKFSSRTDLIIPENPLIELTVKIGDKVRAGETIIGYVQE